MAVEGDGRGREESCRLAITVFSLAGEDWESFCVNQPAFPVRPTCLGGQSRSHLADGQYLTVARASRTNHWRTPLPSSRVLAADNVQRYSMIIPYFISVTATVLMRKKNTAEERRRSSANTVHVSGDPRLELREGPRWTAQRGRATTVMHAWNPSRGRRDP